ncbi:hypothetical protein HORIV_10310 [Vreelandella olivaria]|uniref:Pheromone n=1 Tax=Vreelandella olivaria TaxID=390919 RepID=A0ABM7GDM8_9GAMM|nr:hypothetical protein HORIV_10310 [Halomonas olivaria]
MASKITPPFIASNLAIDFINTQFGVGEEQQECLEDDRSVIAWLQQVGVLSEECESPPLESSTLRGNCATTCGIS